MTQDTDIPTDPTGFLLLILYAIVTSNTYFLYLFFVNIQVNGSIAKSMINPERGTMVLANHQSGSGPDPLQCNLGGSRQCVETCNPMLLHAVCRPSAVFGWLEAD